MKDGSMERGKRPLNGTVFDSERTIQKQIALDAKIDRE